VDRPQPSIPEYELLRQIGRGSYGEVWLARSVTGLYRAVKIIYRHQFEDERPYEREFAGIKSFEPVSRAHESQLDILQVGRNDSAGYFYYVMELADDAGSEEPSVAVLDPGKYAPKTLKAILGTRQRLTVPEVLPIAVALADALTHLHARGLVHRDIKPSNIIFVSGRPKLADIGLVTASDATRSFVGTEGFVPREGPGTAQADIFALGKVLYEACTGRDRLEFPSLPEDLEALPDRAELGEFNEILLKACDPEPGLRYASAADLQGELELIRAQRSVRRLRTLERTVRRGRRAGAVATLVALIVGIGWYQSHRFNRMAASQLAHVYVKNGQERLEQNDWLGALPWFGKALDLDTGLNTRQTAHRLRIANTLEWCPRLTALYTHSRPARYAFFDSEARRVLLCDEGTTAQIWDPETDQRLTPDLVHGGQPFLGLFSPDGSRVATLSRGEGAARLWDARTGTAVGRPIFHGKQVVAVAFSPDGRWLATAGDDGLARLWHAADGSETGLVFHHGAPVSALAFSRDGRRLLTLGGARNAAAYVCLWDTSAGTIIGEPLKESDSINTAELTPDGNALVTGSASGRISLWSLGSNWSVRWRQSLDRPVVHAAFNREGNRLLVTSDWSARLLDAHTGEPIGPLIQAAGMLRSADFDSEGKRFILAGESRTALIYDSQTGHPQIPVIKHGGEVYNAFFLKQSDGWITASADGTVRRWTPCRGDQERAVLAHTRNITHLLVAPDSRRIITLDDSGILRRWPLLSGAAVPQATLPLASPATAAALSSEGRDVLIAGQDGSLVVVSVDDCKPIATVKAPMKSIQRVAPSPAQTKAALCESDGTAWLCDWQTGVTEALPVPETGLLSQVAFSPDGRKLAIASGREVIVFELGNVAWRIVARFQHNDRIWHVGFGAPGTKLLASSEDRVMRWWNPASGSPLSPPVHGDGGISFAEFSTDQQQVFTSGANYDAMVWDTSTGRPITPPFKPRPGLRSATFSPDKHWLVTTSSDGTLQVWDSSSGEPMTPPLAALGPVSFCRFTPDGRWIITVENGNTAIGRPFLVDARSTESSAAEAALLAGYRVDDHGLLEPLGAKESAHLAKRTLVR
jgi:WD40 repeat protein/serine/threonine protein kinase